MKLMGRMQLAALVAGIALAGALGTSCGSSSTTNNSTPSSGASSGSMAVLNLNGDTYAFVPSPTGMSKVKVAAGSSLALTAGGAGSAAAQPLALTPLPDACAADYKNGKVVCASYFSDKVHVIDPGSNTLVGTYATGLTTYAGFSGGSCIICGLLYDETDNKIILSTAGGYALFDHLGTHAIVKTIASKIAENFGYDIKNNRIFSPQYQDFGAPTIDLIDVTGGKIYTLTPPPVGLYEPDHGAVDFNTGIAYATEEGGLGAYLLDLGNAKVNTPVAGQFQATTVNVTITTLIAGRLTDVAIDSDAHYAFLSEEFMPSFAVAKLPAVGGGTPALGDYAVSKVPNPPLSYWSGSGDPHGISNFTLSSGTKHYGLLVDGSKTWLAVVDMDKLLAAPRDPTSTHDVLATYDLVANGVVKFYGL